MKLPVRTRFTLVPMVLCMAFCTLTLLACDAPWLSEDLSLSCAGSAWGW